MAKSSKPRSGALFVPESLPGGDGHPSNVAINLVEYLVLYEVLGKGYIAGPYNTFGAAFLHMQDIESFEGVTDVRIRVRAKDDSLTTDAP